MTERICCICKAERCVTVVRFNLLRMGYPMGEACCASWTHEANALAESIDNPAKVQVAFRQWMRRVAA